MTPNLYRLSNEFEINFIYTMKCSWEVYQDGEKCYSMKFLPQYLLLQITRVMDFFGRATDLFGRSAWLRLEAEATSIFFFFPQMGRDTQRKRREEVGRGKKGRTRKREKREAQAWWWETVPSVTWHVARTLHIGSKVTKHTRQMMWVDLYISG